MSTILNSARVHIEAASEAIGRLRKSARTGQRRPIGSIERRVASALEATDPAGWNQSEVVAYEEVRDALARLGKLRKLLDDEQRPALDDAEGALHRAEDELHESYWRPNL